MDTDVSEVSPFHFQFVESPIPTKNNMLLDMIPHLKDVSVGTITEVCPEAWRVSEECAKIIENRPGSALFIDYANLQPGRHTLRVIY